MAEYHTFFVLPLPHLRSETLLEMFIPRYLGLDAICAVSVFLLPVPVPNLSTDSQELLKIQTWRHMSVIPALSSGRQVDPMGSLAG